MRLTFIHAFCFSFSSLLLQQYLCSDLAGWFGGSMEVDIVFTGKKVCFANHYAIYIQRSIILPGTGSEP